MPFENLIGRAEIIFFSVADDGEASCSPGRGRSTIRWNRFFKLVDAHRVPRTAASADASTTSEAPHRLYAFADREPADVALTHASCAARTAAARRQRAPGIPRRPRARPRHRRAAVSAFPRARRRAGAALQPAGPQRDLRRGRRARSELGAVLWLLATARPARRPRQGHHPRRCLRGGARRHLSRRRLRAGARRWSPHLGAPDRPAPDAAAR